jgi:Zn-dependent protease
MPTERGSFRLFQIAGIEVFLHWTWFLVAAYAVQVWRFEFSSPIWAVYLYLGLFALVTMHEFGHALACRQMGGQADRIVLWPLGGIAFVRPPHRAGAMLWTIAAGPLVNVMLLPVLGLAVLAARRAGLDVQDQDLFKTLSWIWKINAFLLLFNLVPIYPLDGGQILRALLWFPLGPARSLAIASGVGVIGAGLFGLRAILIGSWWYAIMAFFLLSQAVAGWRYARYLKWEAAAMEASLAPDGTPIGEKKPVL